MEIAQITATFPPYMGGTGNVCYHNSLELAKLGHDVTVFTSRFPDIDYTYPDLIHVKRFKPVFRIGNAPLIPELLKLKGFDIVHLHYPFYFGGETVYLISKLREQKYIITYHQDVVFEGFLNVFPKIHALTIAKLIINSANKICVTSFDHAKNSFIKEIIEKRQDSVVEIPNGVDIHRFNPNVNGNPIREMYQIGDEKVILFVGALDRAHYFKGVEYLLKSFAKLGNHEAKLIIVGEGELKKYYEFLSKKLGIRNKTIFAGKVSDDDLPKYYSASDLLVLPSISVEMFGIVLVEAMSTGRPVISTELPGVRTVVDDGVNGFLVKPRNVEELTLKIDYLLENEDIMKKFGKMGRKKVEERYSWEKIGKKLERVYQEVLNL